MDAGLKDQIVLITGASGGIGTATARAFATEGAHLALHAHTQPDKVHRLASELETDCLAVQADLTSESETRDLFQRTLDHFGRLDVLVANAGIWPREPEPINEMSLDRWQRVLEANQTSVFLSAREFLRHLAPRRLEPASVVIVGSTAAVFGEEGHGAYAATKAAITYGLTLTLKNEIVRLAPQGRVNAVCPGWTLTPMAEDEMADREAVLNVLQTRPLPRIARATEIASAIVFLASPLLAGHVTGQVLTVSGGMEGRLLHRRDGIDPDRA